jgi:hypothetical protein
MSKCKDISYTWTSCNFISTHYLCGQARLSAGIGTSEPRHRAQQSPDNAATAAASYGGRGDTPLSRRIFSLRRHQRRFRQLAQPFLGK